MVCAKNNYVLVSLGRQLLQFQSIQVKVTHYNLATLCTPPFLKLEKHAYCTTDLVVLDRFCALVKVELFEDLGRIYLRMMKMLHLCDYPMAELVSVLAHASGR